MKPLTHLIFVSALILSACATNGNGERRDVTVNDLRKHKLALVGKEVSIVGATERRLDGRPEIDIWLSAAARAHVFGAVRSDYCVLAADDTGRLKAMQQWSIVRITGLVRSDPSIKVRSMECPSTLVVSVSHIEINPYPH